MNKYSFLLQNIEEKTCEVYNKETSEWICTIPMIPTGRDKTVPKGLEIEFEYSYKEEREVVFVRTYIHKVNSKNKDFETNWKI